MGQYYRFINLDKKEECEYQGLLKLREHSYLNNDYCMDILSLISNDWKGDRVIHVGDYASGDDGTTTCEVIKKIEQENYLSTSVYDWGDSFKNISPAKVNSDIRYVYNLDKEEFIDLYKQPVQWFSFDRNKVYATKFNSFGLLTACGNGQGGGDYYRNNKSKIGMWAGDRFLSSSSLLKEYEHYSEVKIIFNDFLPLKKKIKTFDATTEARIYFAEGIMLQEDFDIAMKYGGIENLQKVKLQKDGLLNKEFAYLNKMLDKYKNKEQNKSIQEVKNSIDNDIEQEIC